MSDRTLLEQAHANQRRALGHDDEDEETDRTRTLAEGDRIQARATRIGDDEYDVDDSLTGPTFDDSAQNYMGGEHGRPRPREFWTARQLGRTPPMQLIKITVAQQLTGGRPITRAPDDDLSGAAADFGDLVVDVYQGPHFQELSFDNLLTAAVSDLLDFAYAYWEKLPSENGEFPIAAFKPLPPLQVQHSVNEDTGDLEDDPAFWYVPYRRGGGSISAPSKAVGLERDCIVVMRDPQSTRSDRLYGESVATKVREWLEIIVDVDVHQKRHYSDSQLPAGFLHFLGSVQEDKLNDIEDDIVEAAGDPHDLVTVSTEDQASWIPVGESVVDLDAIQEQQWYFKLVLAAAGLNANELGLIEGSGFAKETPALQRAIFKKVTKPMLNAVLDPQNNDAVPQMQDALGPSLDETVLLDIERFDPVQEQIERNETMDEWREKAVSLNELRGGIGREGIDLVAEVPELGGEVNIADLPRYVVDLFLDTNDQLFPAGDENGGGNGSEGASQSGPPDFENDPVLSHEEAFAEHGYEHSERAEKQLEDTIAVKSSFIESTAYAESTEFMQIEFEKTGQNAIYWYGGVPRWRFFNFLQASSKGSYFNKYIRHTGDPGYTYARVQ